MARIMSRCERDMCLGTLRGSSRVAIMLDAESAYKLVSRKRMPSEVFVSSRLSEFVSGFCLLISQLV